MKRVIGIFAIVLLCSWHTAWATVVMDFTFVGDFGGDPAPGEVTFRLTFDSIADADPSANSGSYTAKVALLSGGSSIDSQQPVTVVVENDVAGLDRFFISSAGFPSILSVDGFATDEADFRLTSTDTSMLSSDALPVNPTDPNFPSKVQFSDVTLGSNDGSQSFSPTLSVLTISTPAPVPEPSAYVLLFAGLAGMFGAVRMRRA